MTAPRIITVTAPDARVASMIHLKPATGERRPHLSWLAKRIVSDSLEMKEIARGISEVRAVFYCPMLAKHLRGMDASVLCGVDVTPHS